MSLNNIIAAVVPWTRNQKDKGKDSGSSQTQTSEAPDNTDALRPLLRVDLTPKQSFGTTIAPPSYGTAGLSVKPSSSLRGSPERYRRDSPLGRVPEENAEAAEVGADEEGDEVELDLEAQGLYAGVCYIYSRISPSFLHSVPGSYRRAVAWFSLVPLTSCIVFVVLALLPSLAWPSERHSPSNNTRYFPFPLPEILVAAALWSLSHLIRDPIYTVVSIVVPYGLPNAIVFNAIHVTLTQFLRLSALAVLRIRHQMDFPLPTSGDQAFQRVWWITLGWSLAEVSAGIAQGYSQLALYRSVMLPPSRIRSLLAKSNITASPNEILPLSSRSIRLSDNADLNSRPLPLESSNSRGDALPADLEEDIESEVDQEVEQLIEIKDREELEEIYGIPFIVSVSSVLPQVHVRAEFWPS